MRGREEKSGGDDEVSGLNETEEGRVQKDYFCLGPGAFGASEVLGDEEGLEVQVLDGRREALKTSFRREKMEGVTETTITGRKPRALSRPQTRHC